jgi:hypothetical protein
LPLNFDEPAGGFYSRRLVIKKNVGGRDPARVPNKFYLLKSIGGLEVDVILSQ